jgi:glycosyltransferase involved in cell wall biosynthesis
MRDYLSIPEAKIRVATLGVNTNDLSVSSRLIVSGSASSAWSGPFTIGFFARIAPEKGLHNLADAYRILRTEKGLPPSRLLAAGYLPPEHKPYLAGIAESLHAAGLGDEFVYRGTVDRAKKIRFFHDIDVLSVPSPYREPKGLYLLEAMACGVPVVQPDFGAFPEIIARTGGGLLAKSEAGADVADAILQLWKDPARAAALGRAGAEGVRKHYTVQHMAAGVLKAYQDAQRTTSVEAIPHTRG